MKLPLYQAEVVASKEKEPAPVAAPAPAPVVIAAIPKDAMVMEANQVKAGSTRFLNGTWRAILDVKDPITGKPPCCAIRSRTIKASLVLFTVTMLSAAWRFSPGCTAMAN